MTLCTAFQTEISCFTLEINANQSDELCLQVNKNPHRCEHSYVRKQLQLTTKTKKRVCEKMAVKREVKWRRVKAMEHQDNTA